METVITGIIPAHRRILLCRIIFSFILFTLLYSLLSNTLFHQLRSPVLKYPYVDPAYWLMHLFRIPDFIVSNQSLAITMDILLFVTCVGCIVFPTTRWLIGVFMLLYFIYFITCNSYGGHHTHSRIGILLVPLPFLFSNMLTFSLLWQALRYYTLYVYASAFLWKLFRLTFLNADHGTLILKNNLASYIIYNPDSGMAKCYSWLMQHPSFVNGIYIAGIIAEGIFIIGFFTKKYDRLLLLLSVLLITGFWFFADALFFQSLIFSFTLVRINNLYTQHDFKRMHV